MPQRTASREGKAVAADYIRKVGVSDNVSDLNMIRMPASVVAALYLAACLLPLGLALTMQVAPADRWEAAAAALGLIGLAAMAVQFVTSGRFNTVSQHLGIDKIMAFHKIAAWWLFLALILHPLLYIFPTWLDEPALGLERLSFYLGSPHYRTGVIALAALALLILTSVLRGWLPWRYEVWRVTHLPLGMVAMGAGVHHAVTAGRFSVASPVYDLWLVLAAGVALITGLLYGWRWLQLHRRPWQLASVTKLADRLWELDIQPKAGTPPLKYRAGQFVWMTVGKRRFPLFDHPFSIADSPLRPGLSLIIKEVGDFTNQIGTLKPGTPIGIDGPYGEFVIDAARSETVLLIAGGVGIAPIMGILRDLAARRDSRAVRLAYAVGTPANIACREEIEAAKGVLDLQTMFLSEEAPHDWDGIVGRLDRARLEDLLVGSAPVETTVLMCGPGPMITAVSDTLIDIGVPMDRIIYERFDYAGGAASRQDRRRSRNFLLVGAILAASAGVFAMAVQ